MRRRRKQRQKWILTGLAPILAGAAWWAGRKIRRREPGRARYFPTPPPAYGIEPAPDYSARSLEQAEPVVPVTAPKKSRPGGSKRGTARIYEAPATPAQRMRAGVESERRFPWLLALIPLAILIAYSLFALLGQSPVRAQVVTVPGGDVESGRREIQSWGCGSCHTIPGIPGAYGKVGPQLDQLAEQTYIAGIMPNTPDNLIRWIMAPQEIQPGNAMPNTGVSEDIARNMAAFLYSIR